MSKQEFINILRASLSGQVSAAVVSENVTYYEDYINSQIRMGRTEQEVLQSLGNPRLIARTIIDASVSGTQGTDNRRGNKEPNNQPEKERRRLGKAFKLPIWLVLILLLAIIFFIFSLVMKVIFLFAPFLMVMLLVVFLVKLFRDWLN